MRSTLRPAVLAAGDALALVIFAVIGLVSHHKGVGAHGLARDALPLLLGWFAAAGAVGLYRRPSLRAFLASWALGITAGVLLRGVILHRHVFSGRELTFLGVTLAVTLVLLAAWRRGVAPVLARARDRRPARMGGRR